jgi:rod shape determining protein RodA
MKYSYNKSSFVQKSKPDWLVIILFLILSVFGVLNVFSASTSPEDAIFFDFSKNHGKQLIFLGIALIMGFFIMLITGGFFQISAYWFYIVVMILLLAVLAIGTKVGGAKSWISIGSFKLQPAEFAKFATVLALAKYLGAYDVKFSGLKHVGISLAIIALPFVLTLAQNDTGSALVFFSFALVLYREGLSGYWLVIGVYVIVLFVLSIVFEEHIIWTTVIVIGAVVAFVGRKLKNFVLLVFLVVVGSIALNFGVDVFFNKVLKQYQRDRILVILNLKEDKKDIGYNLNQSQIAIGAGQLVGRGFMQGTQNRMGFVPEQSTDFIFCTIGEEWGFLGTAALIITYLFFIGRIAFLAERQRTVFARIVGYGTFSIFLIHFFINIGMTIGIVPVIGIPLPFFSYGGSSFIAFSMLLFTFLNLDSRRVFEVSRL